MNRSLQVSLWALAALLTACGGGGGSAGDPSPPPPSPVPSPPPPPPPNGSFNVNAAWRNLLQGTSTNSWSTTGTASNGKQYSIDLLTAPAPSEVFSMTGNSYSAADTTVRVGVQGLGLHVTVSRSYYDPSNFDVVGTRSTFDNNAPTCSVVSATTAPPTTAAMSTGSVATSGPLETFVDFNSCVQASAQKTGTSVTTWSLEPDGTINLFCLNTISKDNNNAVLSTQSACVEIDPIGTLGTHARLSQTDASGVSIVTKNY